MRIMASRAGHLRRAGTELIIAPLARADRASARIARRAKPAFPRPWIMREQDGVALRAGVIDPLRLRAGLTVRRRDADQRADRGERRLHGRLLRVLARAVVARLASDAQLD